MRKGNILVTGGAGYIGSHACRALADAGYLPITVDNLCLGHREFVKWGPLIETDIRNSEALAAIMRAYDIAAVMHFAAFSYVGESMANPQKYYEMNIGGTLSVLDAMRRCAINNIIFSSSCAVYGSPDSSLISERTTPVPINPYGRSKLMSESIIADYAAAYDLNYITLRYFNASGADPSAGTGENRRVETRLIPRTMMVLQGHIKQIEIFGDDFPTQDGTAVRDYIHVRDLADGHVLALNRLLSGGESREIYNLGVGKGYSVREILTLISQISRQDVKPIIQGRRQGDPAILVADSSRANVNLGFAPKYSTLTNIIESAWQWHQMTHPKLNWRQSRIG